MSDDSRPAPVSNSNRSPGASPSGVGPGTSLAVVLLAKPKASPDGELALALESELRKRGHSVFLDRRTGNTLEWARTLEREVRQADLIVPLVSAASAQSELLAYELELAVQVAQRQGGWPRILPVRLYYKGPLSETLSSILTPIEFEWDPDTERYRSHLVQWNSPADDSALAEQIHRHLLELDRERRETAATPTVSRARTVRLLEPLGGAVPLDSAFYVARPTDIEFHAAIRRHDSLVLVKGARQMGKTSLLARGLQQARDAGFRVVLTDFQKLHTSHFGSARDCFTALTELVAEQLSVAVPSQTQWDRNANAAFERFWTAEVLNKLNRPVLWAIDEFDRLFTTPFGSEVCGLLRSWHNERALQPDGPWRLLTIAIAFATEAHLFISDLNQSPFNVGTRLALSDFRREEVAELNRRYGGPLRDNAELDHLLALLGGQPYLVRCGLQELTLQNAGVELIEQLADVEDSVFGEHLRRLLISLGGDPVVLESVKGLLLHRLPPPAETFYRLRSAGVVVGASPADARIRCGLYEKYLRRHLA